jgi:DNA-binding transcriptional MerR regulator
VIGMEGLRGIGRMARESGLSVSALRFYDGAGLLTPTVVDPRSGYRYYDADQLALARLVAGLRRVDMPLAGIRDVLARRHDPVAVDALLDAHLRRLEQGLADARRELSSIRSLLEEDTLTVGTTTARVRAADLVAALRAVRFAVAVRPSIPALGAVLFDFAADALTLVATDRYRLAAAPVAQLDRSGPETTALVPVELADRLTTAGEVVTLTVRDGRITVDDVEGALLPDAFPDYRRLLDAATGRATPVDPTFRSALAAAPTRTMTREDGVSFETAVLGLSADGDLTVGADGEIGVNREFLLQAFDAGGPGQLELLLDGPPTPLVIRSARSTSLLMPVRL